MFRRFFRVVRKFFYVNVYARKLFFYLRKFLFQQERSSYVVRNQCFLSFKVGLRGLYVFLRRYREKSCVSEFFIGFCPLRVAFVKQFFERGKLCAESLEMSLLFCFLQRKGRQSFLYFVVACFVKLQAHIFKTCGTRVNVFCVDLYIVFASVQTAVGA